MVNNVVIARTLTLPLNEYNPFYKEINPSDF